MPFGQRHFVWHTESGDEGEKYLKGLVDFDREGLTFVELSAASWILHVEEFLDARKNGLDAMAFRYNELLSDRASTLRKVFDYCGVVPKKMGGAIHAFEADAHEGELTAHSKSVQELTPDDVFIIKNILGISRLTLSPDIIL